MENPRLDFEIEHLEDLKKAFNDGYSRGKAEAEAYMLHCGDELPITNADRIRGMGDEELAELFWILADCNLCPNRKRYCSDDCKGAWLKWLHEEVKDD